MSNFAVLAREFLAVNEAAERHAAVDPTVAASVAGKTGEVVEKEARGDMWRDEPRPIRLRVGSTISGAAARRPLSWGHERRPRKPRPPASARHARRDGGHAPT